MKTMESQRPTTAKQVKMGEQKYYFNPGRQVNIRKFLINPEGEADEEPRKPADNFMRIALDLHKLGKYHYEEEKNVFAVPDKPSTPVMHQMAPAAKQQPSQ